MSEVAFGQGARAERRPLPGLAATTRLGAKGLALTYVSLVVLIPLAALLDKAFAGGVVAFWRAVSSPEARDALGLTLACAAAGALVNAVAGLAIAWVLVLDRFKGQSLLNAIMDLPFALPTVVAGVTLYALYGPDSPLHLNITGTWIGITVAIMFVTLPFTVRAVQPVLDALTFHAEDAASTLGASSRRIFLTVTIPSLAPALLTGTGLAFARAIGEYGSVVFISNNLPYRSQVASSFIYSLTTSGQTQVAGAVSVALLALALATLVVFGAIGRRVSRGLR